MNVILLSGGSGKRLWPLSNDIRSKQFIKLFKTEEGEYQSMIQRVYGQILSVEPTANVTIATSKSQVSAIQNHLGAGAHVCVEPCRRDTFPAILLATAYLHDVLGVSEEEPVVVCPVDPYVEKEYFETLKKLSDRAKESCANLVLMGIKPSYPSEKYGYILPKEQKETSEVDSFKEKPTVEKAAEYIAKGALWNGGVFAYKIGYVLQKAQEYLGYRNYRELLERYETLPKISFDYAIVEKENAIEVMRYSGEWKDVGTWNTLTEVMSERVVGKALLDETCQNVHIVNELNVPVLAIGLKDVVVSAGPEGILVSDKSISGGIKPFVDTIEQQVMFAEKSWGSFRILNVEKGSLTIKVTLKAGRQMNYHSHKKRDEVWVVVSGKGQAVVDGEKRDLVAGDVLSLPCGCRHTVFAKTDLIMIEVQTGEEITIHDKEKHSLE